MVSSLKLFIFILLSWHLQYHTHPCLSLHWHTAPPLPLHECFVSVVIYIHIVFRHHNAISYWPMLVCPMSLDPLIRIFSPLYICMCSIPDAHVPPPVHAGIDDEEDVDRDLLIGIYERVKLQEFRPGVDHVTQVMKVEQTIVGNRKPVRAQ